MYQELKEFCFISHNFLANKLETNKIIFHTIINQQIYYVVPWLLAVATHSALNLNSLCEKEEMRKNRTCCK